MCGIAGVICFDSGCGGQLHELLVRTMCELTAHRGPDDSGVMSRSRYALGSQRLSIIDLSPAGHMPMSDASGRWWITYNGEVYNFETVREELLRLGHSFRSRTDTEVILHAYMEWGEGCMDRFVGMFAFAILDAERGDVALVRDRYGIKPLYYARSGSHLLFASEIKALMGLLERPQVDRHSLLEWSLYRNVDALTPETLVEDVRSVLPGHGCHCSICASWLWRADGRPAYLAWFLAALIAPAAGLCLALVDSHGGGTAAAQAIVVAIGTALAALATWRRFRTLLAPLTLLRVGCATALTALASAQISVAGPWLVAKLVALFAVWGLLLVLLKELTLADLKPLAIWKRSAA